MVVKACLQTILGDLMLKAITQPATVIDHFKLLKQLSSIAVMFFVPISLCTNNAY